MNILYKNACQLIKILLLYILVLVAVDELVVYKKNLKRKSIGIRWSFPEEYIVNGFIIMAIDNNINSAKQIVVEPKKCTAWPMLYCATIENLIPNNEYTIKVIFENLSVKFKMKTN